MEKTAVLIVGAGPVGLTMAVELARRGTPFRIIDKAPEPSSISKALAVHARTLELLEDMSVLEEFVARGQVTHGVSVYHQGHRLVHLSFSEVPSPHPFVVMIPQSETERILFERLSEQGFAVERSHELLSVTQNGIVRSTVKKPDGSEEIIESDWLVACDGAHSIVRHNLNLTFQGTQYQEIFGAVDAHVNTHLPNDELNSFLSEKGAFVLFPLPNNRWRILYDLEQTETRDKDAVPTLEEAQMMMDERGPGVPISDPTWCAYFRVHRRIVEQYRHGRIFLAGDSAHIHSPVGGVGMNTGMQDAINLAWKLDLVTRGLAGEKLLDSYHSERHPIAKEVLGGTDLATKVATLRNPISQAVRNTLIPMLVSHEVIQQRMIRTGSLIAVNYRHSNIVGEHRAGLFVSGAEVPSIGERFEFANGPRPGDRAPDSVAKRSPDEEEARLFDIIRDTKHKLIMFDGADASPEGYANMVKIAMRMNERYAELVSVFLVTPQMTLPPELPNLASQIYDHNMSLHHLFGANCECMYLIRPDGYVGFRSQPALLDKLEHHLDQLLAKATAKTV